MNAMTNTDIARKAASDLNAIVAVDSNGTCYLDHESAESIILAAITDAVSGWSVQLSKYLDEVDAIEPETAFVQSLAPKDQPLHEEIATHKGEGGRTGLVFIGTTLVGFTIRIRDENNRTILLLGSSAPQQAKPEDTKCGHCGMVNLPMRRNGDKIVCECCFQQWRFVGVDAVERFDQWKIIPSDPSQDSGQKEEEAELRRCACPECMNKLSELRDKAPPASGQDGETPRSNAAKLTVFIQAQGIRIDTYSQSITAGPIYAVPFDLAQALERELSAATSALVQAREERDEKQKLIEIACRDWADDDSRVKEFAAKHGIKGDDGSGYFMGVIEMAEQMSALIESLQSKLADVERRDLLASGYHQRTPREVKIQAALDETPVAERDSADIAIGELLELVDAGRNRVHFAEDQADTLRARLAEVEKERDELSLIKEQNAALVKDKERLDWLEEWIAEKGEVEVTENDHDGRRFTRNRHTLLLLKHAERGGANETFREAIDAAIANAKETK